jgi:hypothetical protein
MQKRKRQTKRMISYQWRENLEQDFMYTFDENENLLCVYRVEISLQSCNIVGAENILHPMV